MMALDFVTFFLTATSVKKVTPHRAEMTKTTLAFVVFVLTAYSVKGGVSWS
jgi:hypothetical protein